MARRFIFTGGGTGGHIYPAIAVADEIRRRGHEALFIGSEEKMEARLVPAAGFPIRFVRTGALNRVNFKTRVRSAFRIPLGVLDAARHLRDFAPAAVFSTGGYVAGPVMMAALARRTPLVILEPNATPGAANRLLGRWATEALAGFESTANWFPQGRTEVTGLPVRAEFFAVRPKESGLFTLLVTGGSQGARTLNRASRESWPLFREAGTPIRFLLQCGPREHAELAGAFSQSGLEGEVVPFVQDMPAAFSQADLVLARSGAGSVNEIAASGMASVLVPLPFAADDHQRKNAEALANEGAAHLVLDQELTGQRLFQEVEALRNNPSELDQMRLRVRRWAHRDAAQRAADALERATEKKVRESVDRRI